MLLQPAGIGADSDQPADVVEHDFLVRECTGNARDVAKLRMKDYGIERESETAKDRESLSKRLVAEQPLRHWIGRIDE